MCTILCCTATTHCIGYVQSCLQHCNTTYCRYLDCFSTLQLSAHVQYNYTCVHHKKVGGQVILMRRYLATNQAFYKHISTYVNKTLFSFYMFIVLSCATVQLRCSTITRQNRAAFTDGKPTDYSFFIPAYHRS